MSQHSWLLSNFENSAVGSHLQNSQSVRSIERLVGLEPLLLAWCLGPASLLQTRCLCLVQARLTCPCCNTRKKDAVLTKCFHVFCFECVRGRYEARQRKCPKCNAAFGAHDFHRVYIS